METEKKTVDEIAKCLSTRAHFTKDDVHRLPLDLDESTIILETGERKAYLIKIERVW